MHGCIICIYENLRTLLSSILKLESDCSLLVCGMVCSSWVAISRASTGRQYFLPLGFPESASAEKGNILVSRPGFRVVRGCIEKVIATFATHALACQDDTRLHPPDFERMCISAGATENVIAIPPSAVSGVPDLCKGQGPSIWQWQVEIVVGSSSVHSK